MQCIVNGVAKLHEHVNLIIADVYLNLRTLAVGLGINQNKINLTPKFKLIQRFWSFPAITYVQGTETLPPSLVLYAHLSNAAHFLYWKDHDLVGPNLPLWNYDHTVEHPSPSINGVYATTYVGSITSLDRVWLLYCHLKKPCHLLTTTIVHFQYDLPFPHVTAGQSFSVFARVFPAGSLTSQGVMAFISICSWSRGFSFEISEKTSVRRL